MCVLTYIHTLDKQNWHELPYKGMEVLRAVSVLSVLNGTERRHLQGCGLWLYQEVLVSECHGVQTDTVCLTGFMHVGLEEPAAMRRSSDQTDQVRSDWSDQINQIFFSAAPPPPSPIAKVSNCMQTCGILLSPLHISFLVFNHLNLRGPHAAAASVFRSFSERPCDRPALHWTSVCVSRSRNRFFSHQCLHSWRVESVWCWWTLQVQPALTPLCWSAVS